MTSLPLKVERGDPRDPGATALLRESHALMEELFPPEDNAHLSIDALCEEGIHFFVARLDSRIVGTAALAEKGSYVELKSMFVAQSARGLGAADKMMSHLRAQAKDLGATAMRLETGDALHAARKLYARHGFTEIGPFGDYVENGTSVFMEKAL